MNVRIGLLACLSLLISGAAFAGPEPQSSNAGSQAEVIARIAGISHNDALIALGQRSASYHWFVQRQDRVHSNLQRGLGPARYAAIFGDAAQRARAGSMALASRIELAADR